MVMRKPENLYEPHLSVSEFSFPAGGEWAPKFPGWTLIQVTEGTGYCLQPNSSLEMEPGTVLLFAHNWQGTIRASQLGGMSLQSFSIKPDRLTGLVTLSEQALFETASSRKELAFQILASHSPIAVKLKALHSNRGGQGLLFRLKLLELFVEVFGENLNSSESVEKSPDARARLEKFLRQAPASELLELSFSELARLTRCTSRHLSRIFVELTGASYRDKRAELRLILARELLATSNCKIVEVALQSGYRSLSLFNKMFRRHFGISPGRWRQKHGSGRVADNHRYKRADRLAA